MVRLKLYQVCLLRTSLPTESAFLMTNNELIDKIQKEIIGTPQYGFEAKMWQDFIEQNFSRNGEIEGESYSSELNQVLSAAAVYHVLSHIRSSLNKLKTDED